MKAYFEELWERLPEDARPSELALRRAFLLQRVRSGERVLDLGCGDGTFTAELAAVGVHAVGADVAEAALERARARHPGLALVLVGLDQPLPFADNAFEAVWAGEVIEHVGDTARWLSEVRRVLVPGGRLLLSTPAHSRLLALLHGVEAFSDPLGDHLHLYTRRSLQGLLEGFGFADIRIQGAGGPPLLRRTLLASAVR